MLERGDTSVHKRLLDGNLCLVPCELLLVSLMVEEDALLTAAPAALTTAVMISGEVAAAPEDVGNVAC